MSGLAYYLLVLLWTTPHWKRGIRMLKWLKLLWLSRPFLRWSRIHPGDVVVLRGQSYPMHVQGLSHGKVHLECDPMPGELVHTIVAMSMSRSALQREAAMVNGRRVITW